MSLQSIQETASCFKKKIDKKGFSKYLPFFLTELDFTSSDVEVIACNTECKRIVFRHRIGIPNSDIGMECYYIMNLKGDILSANYNFSFLRYINSNLDLSNNYNLLLTAHECFNFMENTKFNFDPEFKITATRILNDTCFLAIYDLRNGRGLHEYDNAFIFSVSGRKLYSFKFDGWGASMNGFIPTLEDDTLNKKIWICDNERELLYQFSASNPIPKPLQISRISELKDTSLSKQNKMQILDLSGFKKDKVAYNFLVVDRKGNIKGYYKGGN